MIDEHVTGNEHGWEYHNGVGCDTGCHMTRRADGSAAFRWCAVHRAAPELLEALDAVLRTCEDGVIHRNETGKPQWSALEHMGTIARAAIAKAKGTSEVRGV